MKKLFFILAVLVLFSLSFYTVMRYNKNKSIKTNGSDDANNTKVTVTDQLNQSTAANSSISKNEIFKNTTNSKAINFKLKTLDGKEISLSDFKGKKIFLNFWATWCPPCRQEMPELEKLYQETKDSDIVILTINLGEDAKTVESFMDKNKYNFNVALDLDQDVAIKYSIVSIPTSIFIDSEGNLVSKKIGPMTLEEMKDFVTSPKK
ncbi:TlpA family protein disulfide reductase [Clostridium folliculivorans]|uniref:Thiol:disulfide interchange protein tlpA n=1 Tax=Clostridium folliculivorans TaxID=2886038 RepID=A0A9W6D7H5_9CLOT|nr:TlpA disulfide reductase family protein [Clostridium folliculivorans]GKU23235.1 thiol:disulfide interchange protein tlpA [Clostridium folliculivorans]GKU29352.1 thiol:disulfide interchange protein tlpA [Clostridium folliculivorans]